MLSFKRKWFGHLRINDNAIYVEVMPNNKNKIRVHPPKSAAIRVPSPEAWLKDG